MKRSIAIVLLLIAIVAVTFVFGLPLIARMQVEKVLSERFGQTAHIEDVSISLFPGSVTFDEIAIGDRIRADSIRIDIMLTALADKVLRIEDIALSGVRAPITVADGNVAVADVSFQEESSEAPASSGFSLQLDHISVADSNVLLVINENAYDIQLKQLAVVVPGEEEASLSATGDVDGAEVDLLARIAKRDAGYSIDGEFSIEASDVAAIASRHGYDLGGKVSLSGSYEALFDGEDNYDFRSSIKAGVQGLEYDASVVLGGAAFEGRVDLEFAQGGLANLLLKGDASATETRVEPFGIVDMTEVVALELTQDGVKADSVTVDGFRATVRRLANGTIERMPEGKEESTGPDQMSATTTSSPDGDDDDRFSVDVAVVDVEGGDVRFIDESVTPNVNLLFNEVTAHVENISTAGPLTYTFSARHPEQQDETAAISGSGTFSLLSGSIEGEARLSVSRFDIHELDPYSVETLRSGRLKMNSNIVVKDGVLKADNDVEIVGLKIEEADTGSGQMSVAVALSLLKDKNERINVKIPIESSLDAFTVDTGDIVQTAVTNATREAAVAYAAFALQPYGTLLLLKGVADQMAKPRFEAIEFMPRSSDLSETAAAYVRKLADLLSSRPAISVTVCGYATGRDREDVRAEVLEQTSAELTEVTEVTELTELTELAHRRSEAVKEAITAAGVGEDRLLGCKPSVTGKDGVPRVEISL